jgi:hypothetical protein
MWSGWKTTRRSLAACEGDAPTVAGAAPPLFFDNNDVDESPAAAAADDELTPAAFTPSKIFC